MNDERDRQTREPLVEDRLGERARVFGAERALLAGIDPGGGTDVEASMRELESLAATAGIPTLATVLQKRARPHPATFLGKGKVDEVRRAADELGADVVILNDELSPAQARNLEQAFARKVIDRTQLIMDIFAQRAATKEARLQVELAQLRYLLPRLRGWGAALTRTGGGIGTRGPGETQLELDRNKIHRRIQALERRLRKTHGERALRRKRRSKSDLPQIALVGYTNSGKSTLLNRLCDADATVENKLFATLDTMVRRGGVAPGRSALWIDTVGLIRDLPHDLVPAFAATLEAVRHADLVLHVIDRAARTWDEDRRVVLGILDGEVFGEGEERPPLLTVLNKIDEVTESVDSRADDVAISAREGTNVERLLAQVGDILFPDDRMVDLFVPFRAIGTLRARTTPDQIEVLEHTDRGMRIRGRLSADELRAVAAAGALSASGASPHEPR